MKIISLFLILLGVFRPSHLMPTEVDKLAAKVDSNFSLLKQRMVAIVEDRMEELNNRTEKTLQNFGTLEAKFQAFNERFTRWMQSEDNRQEMLKKCELPGRYLVTRLSTGFYYMFGHEVYTWYEARDRCKDLGLVLASVESYAEVKALSKLARDHDTAYWLYAHKYNGFRWKNGDSVDNWKRGQPDEHTSGEQSCVDLDESTIFDDKCSKHYGYICELPEHCKLH